MTSASTATNDTGGSSADAARSPINIGRAVIDAAMDQNVTFLAASVAYYAFVSLIPALLLLVVVASMVFGDVVAAQLLAATGEFLTPTGEEAIATAIASAQGRSGATVLGLLVLIWSTLKVFRGLDTAFLQVYGVEEPAKFLDQLTDAASVVVGIGIGITVMVVVGAIIAALDGIPFLGLAGVLFLPVLLTVVFLPMYYLLPYPEVTIREALPGAAFAAIGWTVLQAGFQVYASVAGQYQVYGVIGGILLLVTWLYIAAIVVVLGAVINVVLATGRPPVGSDSTGTSAFGIDRQLQQGPDRFSGMNGKSDRGADTDVSADAGVRDERDARDEQDERDARDDTQPRGAPDVAALEAELDRLRAEFDAFAVDVERRTVNRPRLESDLKQYVRARMRRGHARGWGPYLVLLYGTILTLGAFHYLDGWFAIGAMGILGLSTLGLYTLFIIVGVGLNLLETPGKAVDYARQHGDD